MSASNDLELYKIELQTIIDKSQDRFEKRISYISSGGIAVSMVMADHLFKDLSTTNWLELLILGWTPIYVLGQRVY